MSKRKICILSLSPIQSDGRVLREVTCAAKQYAVTVVGWGTLDKPRDHVEMRPVQLHVFSRWQRLLQVALMFGGRFSPQLWERWYWRKPDHQQALQWLLQDKWDLIHVNEAIALPIAIKAAQQMNVPVLYDAHEYSPGQDTDKVWWRILAQPFYVYLMRVYAPQATAMTTVAAGIAEEYHRNFGLQPTVVMNAPDYTQLPFNPTAAGRIRCVHHGVAMRDRHLEKLIEVMAQADARYSLEFMLMEKDAGYLEQLKREAQTKAPGKITFRAPTPPREIATTINSYDIGIHLIPPVNFNNAHALPNKFFEFIMAGLAVIIGPSPEMARIVQQYHNGMVASDFTAQTLAECLNTLTTEQINIMKQNSLAAAKVLNSDNELRKVAEIYRRLLSVAYPT
ncbi:MAG TPA: glycosyltransferase [Anaerolineae bacterium]|nr:glycosyltransferase [Anaerolineae bacterium]